MKFWSFVIKSCRRGSVEVWRSGASQACCGPGDVEEFASRALEAGCNHVDVEVWMYGAGEACCRCKTWRRHKGMEIWRWAAGV